MEVTQLSDVMDMMLEKAGVENQDYTGPTKVTTQISVTQLVVTSMCSGRWGAWVGTLAPPLISW